MFKKCKFKIKCGRNYMVYFNILILKSNILK